MQHITRSLAAIGLATLVCVLSVGCVQTNPKTSDRDVQVVDYEALVNMLNNRRRSVVVVDVRQPNDFAAMRLPMAINIYLPDLQEGDPRLAEAHDIVVYSRGLSDPLSRAAAKRLMLMGYTSVFDFAGGIDLWQRMGGKLVGTQVEAASP